MDQLLEGPADPEGQTIMLEALVERVSPQRRMAILIDLSEADCQDVCGRQTLAALFPENVELPVKGTKVSLRGILRARQDPRIFEVQSSIP